MQIDIADVRPCKRHRGRMRPSFSHSSGVFPLNNYGRGERQWDIHDMTRPFSVGLFGTLAKTLAKAPAYTKAGPGNPFPPRSRGTAERQSSVRSGQRQQVARLRSGQDQDRRPCGRGRHPHSSNSDPAENQSPYSIRTDRRRACNDSLVAGAAGWINQRLSIPEPRRSNRTYEHAAVCPPD